ncbi:AsmA family protein [Parvibaculum sp.]|uniref:AsmA family protein n=1 Tax=Parvibaculum sp. TaxID=2024848 RepID=UPI00272F7ED9|nr:AsmA family protein [Parvibaculum sp.]MDP1627842.1 AsmA family protein [Parvibaculum sp.]MDP2150840.1 AsmA family protein [Parvibaculum sp.]MDP3327615.1 AsmA family protein [Parvibaculum sp.]
MNWRAHPRLAALAIFVLAVVAAVIFWDWNWFRPLVEARASAALRRDVRIGHFDLHISRIPLAVLDDVTVENPPDFGEGEPLATVERLSVSLDALAALRGRTVIPEIRVEKPRGNLRSDGEGRRNWVFEQFSGEQSGGEGGTPPEIGNLVIEDGTVRFADPELQADVTMRIHTETAEDGEPMLVARAEGTYNGQPVDARFRGGALLSLRETEKPYPVDFKARNGDTRISLQGTVVDPLRLAGARLALELEGKTLDDLEPLILIPLVSTPPYRLEGRLDYADGKIRFDDFAGRVGQSDLSGTFTVDPGEERPRVAADLRSERVLLADLGGFIGAAPGEADQPDMSAEQRAEHARAEANPRLLPNEPFEIPDIRAADFHVRYEAARIEGEGMPLDDLVTTLRIENGKVTLKPLDLGVGQGKIASNVVLDAREDPMHVTADVDFHRVDLRRLMEATGVFEGTGTIGGRAVLETRGNSIATMLGAGDGELKLFMAGGDMSALLVDLAGLDLGNSILSLLGLPDRTGIRCMVSDFALEKGVLRTRTLYVDTEKANIVGTGTVNLKDETIDYRIVTEPKQPSIGSVAAPIDIEGRLKDPGIGPDAEALAARAGTAAVLGALLTPLAALLPTIQLGLGEDNDCAESVTRLERESEALPRN